MGQWWAERDALREVLVDMGRCEPPKRTFLASEIERGWVVLDNALEKIGLADGWVEEYLVVRRRFWRTLYVPPSGIGRVREGAVVLNVPGRWISTMGWGKPRSGVASAG